jgi:hypothetical protein
VIAGSGGIDQYCCCFPGVPGQNYVRLVGAVLPSDLGAASTFRVRGLAPPRLKKPVGFDPIAIRDRPVATLRPIVARLLIRSTSLTVPNLCSTQSEPH